MDKPLVIEERLVFRGRALLAAGDRQEMEVAKPAGRSIFGQHHFDNEHPPPGRQRAARLVEKAKRRAVVPVTHLTVLTI